MMMNNLMIQLTMRIGLAMCFKSLILIIALRLVLLLLTWLNIAWLGTTHWCITHIIAYWSTTLLLLLLLGCSHNGFHLVLL
jgi:hypothetical protein